MFNKEISKRLEKKAGNCKIFTLLRYNELVAKLERIKNKGPCPSISSDYKVVKRYILKQLGSEYRIVNKHSGKCLVFVEEMYDIIANEHFATKHGGRDQTFRKIKATYDNITIEMVVLFIERCPCQRKKKKKK